jgi:hypothetical protein
MKLNIVLQKGRHILLHWWHPVINSEREEGRTDCDYKNISVVF